MKNQYKVELAPLLEKNISEGKKISNDVIVEFPLTASLWKIGEKFLLRFEKSPFYNFKLKNLKNLEINSTMTIQTKKLKTSKKV